MNYKTLQVAYALDEHTIQNTTKLGLMRMVANNLARVLAQELIEQDIGNVQKDYDVYHQQQRYVYTVRVLED